MIHPHIAALLSHPAVRGAIERALAARGTHGDTQIAHVSPGEMGMLKSMGGVGSRNPSTGLPQFYGAEGGSSPDAGGGLGGGASTGDSGTSNSGLGGHQGALSGGGGAQAQSGGLRGAIRGALGLGTGGGWLGDFIGGGGLAGLAIRGVGDMLGPSQGVAGGYGAASLGGNRGLGGPMSGDRRAGLDALQNMPYYQVAQMGQGGGGAATPPPPMPTAPPAPPPLAPMMSTTAPQDLTGGAFGALPAWATQPTQIGTAPTSFPVPYMPSQPPPQIYGGQSGQVGAPLGQVGSQLGTVGGLPPGYRLTPQQGWQRDMLQRLGITPQQLAQMFAQQGGRPMNAPFTTIVKGVQQHELAEVWPIAAPLVEKALHYAHGDHDLASVRASLEEGASPRRQLFVTWPTIEAVLLTQIDALPGGNLLVIFACAGRLSSDWRNILREIEEWAHSQGCRASEVRGRLGWERRLPDYTRETLLRKDLT